MERTQATREAELNAIRDRIATTPEAKRVFDAAVRALGCARDCYAEWGGDNSRTWLSAALEIADAFDKLPAPKGAKTK